MVQLTKSPAWQLLFLPERPPGGQRDLSVNPNNQDLTTHTDKILPRKESVLCEARHPVTLEVEVDEELCLLGSFIPVTRVSIAGR